MTNDFTEKTRDLFFWNKKCWWCKKQHANCLHHILGRISNSPLNAAPLNNFECHIGNGKLASIKVQGQLLRKTLKYLEKNNYTLTQEDHLFMLRFKRIYKYK